MQLLRVPALEDEIMKLHKEATMQREEKGTDEEGKQMEFYPPKNLNQGSPQFHLPFSFGSLAQEQT